MPFYEEARAKTEDKRSKRAEIGACNINAVCCYCDYYVNPVSLESAIRDDVQQNHPWLDPHTVSPSATKSVIVVVVFISSGPLDHHQHHHHNNVKMASYILVNTSDKVSLFQSHFISFSKLLVNTKLSLSLSQPRENLSHMYEILAPLKRNGRGRTSEKAANQAELDENPGNLDCVI